MIQADAILEMRLSRLTGMERQKLLDEAGELRARIGALEEILGSELRLMEVVKEELVEIRDKYADLRRTRFVENRGELTMHDLVAEEDQVVTLSRLGYIKRCNPDEWRMQRRGGVGKRGMATRNEDFVTSIFIANTHDVLLVFTNTGKVYQLPVYEVPEAGRAAKGRPIVNLVPVAEDERVAAVVTVRTLRPDEEEETETDSPSLLFISRRGLVKETKLHAYRNLRANGMIAAGVNDGDELVVVRIIEDRDQHLMLFTRNGKCIRFDLAEVPELGRPARGNFGIRLGTDDIVVDGVLVPASAVLDGGEDEDEDEELDAEGEEEPEEGEPTDEPDTTLLTVTELGYGKRTPLPMYRPQRRYGKGIISIQTPDSSGKVVGSVQVARDDQIMLVTDTGRVIRFSASDVRLVQGRNTRGVRLMRLDDGERIVDLARLADTDDEDADEGEE